MIERGPLRGISLLAFVGGCHLVGGYEALTLRTSAQLGWIIDGTGEGDSEVQAIGALPAGRTIVAGSFEQGVVFPETALGSESASAAFVAIAEPDGRIVRALPLESPTSVRTLAASGSTLVGTFEESLRLGATTLQAPSARTSMFLVDFDDDSGNVLRTIGLGGDASISREAPLDVARDSQGNVLVGGSYTGTLTLEGCSGLPTKSKPNLFLAKLAESDRRCLWALSSDDDAPQRVESVAVDGSNDFIVAAGVFVGTLALDLDAPLQNSGGRDLFLARLDGAGRTRWVKSLGNGRFQGSPRVAAAAGGYTALAAFFEGNLEVEAETLSATQGHDILLATYRPDGTLAWRKHLRVPRPPCEPTTCELDDLALAFDADGNLVLAGPFEGRLEMDEYAVSTDGAATFLLKLDRDGKPLWLGHLGAASDACKDRDRCTLALAIDSNRDVLVGGSFTGALQFDGVVTPTTQRPLRSDLGRDAFLAKFAR
jgi:hypothetical protein